jgi:hypothetical protein
MNVFVLWLGTGSRGKKVTGTRLYNLDNFVSRVTDDSISYGGWYISQYYIISTDCDINPIKFTSLKLDDFLGIFDQEKYIPFLNLLAKKERNMVVTYGPNYTNVVRKEVSKYLLERFYPDGV